MDQLHCFLRKQRISGSFNMIHILCPPDFARELYRPWKVEKEHAFIFIKSFFGEIYTKCNKDYILTKSIKSFMSLSVKKFSLSCIACSF